VSELFERILLARKLGPELYVVHVGAMPSP